MAFEAIDIQDITGFQSIKIPDNFKIDDDKVYLKKVGNALYIIPFHNPLQNLIDSLGAQEKIVLAGKRTDIEDFYYRSKIFAFASSSEGFPNVIGEAMSAGLPVVAFDCVAGPAEMIVDAENGFLVPLFDYDTFKEKLLVLMNDQEIRDRLGQAAQRSIKRFSVETIGQEVHSFLLQGL